MGAVGGHIGGLVGWSLVAVGGAAAPSGGSPLRRILMPWFWQKPQFGSFFVPLSLVSLPLMTCRMSLLGDGALAGWPRQLAGAGAGRRAHSPSRVQQAALEAVAALERALARVSFGGGEGSISVWSRWLGARARCSPVEAHLS